MFEPKHAFRLALVLCAGIATACSQGSGKSVGDRGGDGGDGGDDDPPAKGLVFEICLEGEGDAAQKQAQKDALLAFFDAREGDTIRFCEGTFHFTTGLVLHGRKGITVAGAGKDKTFLNFAHSGSSEGLNVSHSDGIVIRGLTLQDTPGNSLRVFKSRFVTISHVRTEWTNYKTCDTDPSADDTCARNGAYGIYPVECDHVLIEHSEAYGASDAGIYVGQSSDIIVRHTRAEYNVAGFEFENTYRATFEYNVATNNTGGFLVFDLPGLRQYGEKNIVRHNKSFGNNIDNFAPIGNIVGAVPRGTGMLMLATDLLEVYGNEIYDNDTVGLAIVNYGLVEHKHSDRKFDFYPEGIYIHDNLFRNNGGNMQEPNPDRGDESFLPLLLKLKNFGRPAHIVWDGAVDRPNSCHGGPAENPTQYEPKDACGFPLSSDNTAPACQDRPEGRRDERGRPNFIRSDTAPNCGADPTGELYRYNVWKFTGEGAAQIAENGLYIHNNRYENTRPETLLTTPFLNARLTRSSTDPEDNLEHGSGLFVDMLTPPSNSLAPHEGPVPTLLKQQMTTLQLPYVPDLSSGEARPTAAEIAAACGKPLANGEINHEALARFNCPLLHQYGLFADASNPRVNPNGGGVPFELTNALFSDYASKYRILYLPPGGKAAYRTGTRATFDLPVGTVIAKTFSFKNEPEGGPATENVVETRLLIKRENATGVNWIGLAYVWNKDTNGNLTTADLRIEGDEADVSWNYVDPDSGVRYTGATSHYSIPAALNCITCHGGDDRESGAAPIGMKARLLNRDNDYDGVGTINQLVHMKNLGLLQGLPANIDTVEKQPRWNVPGDMRVSASGEKTAPTANSAIDLHGRVRSYLEVNCMHCHAGDGAASNSNLFLDAHRVVNHSYGICKKPVAAGKGSGENRLYDIMPGDAAASIMHYRMSRTEPGVAMPPLARSVNHNEAAALVAEWIDRLLSELSGEIQDEEACTGSAFDQLLGQLPSLPFP
jgi:parallel beta-helix repeat protein